MNDLEVKWKEISAKIEQEIGSDDYLRWFEEIIPLRYEKEILVLGVANDFFASWFLNRFEDLIIDTAMPFFSQKIKVKCEVCENPIPLKKRRPVENFSEKKIVKKNLFKKFKTLEISQKFDNFVVGDNNELACAFGMIIAKDPREVEANPFFIYGNTGLGKTHLLNSIANEIRETDPTLKVRYIPSDAFVNDYIDAARTKSFDKFRNEYRKLDVLLIDDIQFLAKKEKIQEEFFHTFNYLVQRNKQIILGSDKIPRDLRDFEKRLVSRFENGHVTELVSPDYDTRLNILRKKMALKNFFLPEDILDYIASNIKSNIRPLEGAINRLSFFQSLKKTEITLEKCHELISNFIDNDKMDRIEVRDILAEVSRYYGVSIENVLKKNRASILVNIRQIAMYLSREMTNHSLPSIGEKFRRNHSTVSHAYKSITNRLVYDKELQRSIKTIKETIK